MSNNTENLDFLTGKASATVPDDPHETVRALLQKQADVLVDTGTGGQRIKDVNSEYIEGDVMLRASLARLGVSDAFPWRDLWEWYEFYSAELPSYRSRRAHVRQLLTRAYAQLGELDASMAVVDLGRTTDASWATIDVRVRGLVAEVASAADVDTWQDVGRRSREILIDLGKLLANPDLVPAGSAPPKGADARAWFEIFLASSAPGPHKSELRGIMRATWDLAQKVTHADVGRIGAFASAQATILIVRAAQMMQEDKPG